MAAASNGLGFQGWRARALASFALVISIASVTACGPGGETGSGGAPVMTTGVGAGGQGGSGGSGGGDNCPENSTRDCHVDLGEHNGVKSCFVGVETCKGGSWGPCTDGTVSERPLPPRAIAPARPAGEKPGQPGQQIKSLGPAVDCVTDPCDPSCQTFQEDPGTPVASPPQILIAPWKTGSYGDLPPAIAALGNVEPCDEGEDCQFDQYCENPASGSCSHHKCAIGGGLNPECDPCVKKICAADPSCCNTAFIGTCAHDLCVTGSALKGPSPGPACDPCVSTICAAGGQYQSCCDSAAGGWTAECVAQVSSSSANGCGKSCNTGSWTASCVDKVAAICGAECLTDPGPPACAHDKCYLGAPLSAACDPCVADVCAVDPFCCAGGWDGKCLQEVATVCGEQCPLKGNCVPWLPTQVDAACTPFDLTVGVGCTTAGVAQVPVCNHGNTAAPAGLPVVALAPSPPKIIPNCYPSLVGATTFNTTVPIPPGKCIDVPMPGIVDGAQVVANPFGAAGYDTSECHCSNNWSVYSAATGACDSPSCAGASTYAKLKKVKLFVTVDRSNSQSKVMPGLPGSPTRWQQLRDGLTSFLSDPGSDDVGVWMRFWPFSSVPFGNCPGPTILGCNSLTGCKTPQVDVPDLTAANETAVLTMLNSIAPSGANTPMFPALDGALLAAEAFQTANPDWVSVVLMITDGEPLSCTTNVNTIASMAAGHFNATGVRTYVIGIAEVSALTIELIAGAGGGKSFAIDAGDAVPVAAKMITALDAIKQDFVSCTLALPNQDIFDPSKAVLTYTPGAGAPITVTEVANLAACAGNGWYYDNPADPTSVTLCPTTCSAVKADTNGTVELKIDCISQYLESTYSQTYEASCPMGQVPQWGYLAYDTATPGDSRVEFRVHTSDTLTFGALPVAASATAAASPDTQICAMGDPGPDCPIALDTALGGLPDVHRKYLELVMKVIPTTDESQTPQINNWQVTYSCKDAE